MSSTSSSSTRSRPGSPFFLPKGAIVYNLAQGLMRDMYQRYGYQEVITPQIFSVDLWKRSGHYDNYKDGMYFIHEEDQELGVKPMNCPGHCVMYAAQVHSYRELPLRYADFGRLHRFERSGTLHGLTRVRSFAQDDAHIYCMMEQIGGEIASLIDMMREAYAAFELGEPRFTLSLRPEKRIGNDEVWDQAEGALRDALQASGVMFTEVEGEGAFYGPKIDLFMDDVLGREWQISTFQLDFNLPERFDLHYAAEDGSLQRPVMIHRAILGSIERFMGILIEQHAGAFPVWLSPVQATLIPIADRHVDYCRGVADAAARGRPARRGGRALRAHAGQDPRRPAPEGALHAHRRRPRHRSRRRFGAHARQRRPRRYAGPCVHGAHSGRGEALGALQQAVEPAAHEEHPEHREPTAMLKRGGPTHRSSDQIARLRLK